MSARFGCPRCGGERIDEVNACKAFYPVTSWDDDGMPVDFDQPDVDPGSACVVAVDPYLCRDCVTAGRECHFSEPARIIPDPAHGPLWLVPVAVGFGHRAFKVYQARYGLVGSMVSAHHADYAEPVYYARSVDLQPTQRGDATPRTLQGAALSLARFPALYTVPAEPFQPWSPTE